MAAYPSVPFARFSFRFVWLNELALDLDTHPVAVEPGLSLRPLGRSDRSTLRPGLPGRSSISVIRTWGLARSDRLGHRQYELGKVLPSNTSVDEHQRDADIAPRGCSPQVVEDLCPGVEEIIADLCIVRPIAFVHDFTSDDCHR